MLRAVELNGLSSADLRRDNRFVSDNRAKLRIRRLVRPFCRQVQHSFERTKLDRCQVPGKQGETLAFPLTFASCSSCIAYLELQIMMGLASYGYGWKVDLHSPTKSEVPTLSVLAVGGGLQGWGRRRRRNLQHLPDGHW